MRVKYYSASILLAVVSTIIAFGIAEVGLRLAYLPNPKVTRNFTTDPVNQQISNMAIQYDPVIGYTARPGYRDGTNSHGRLGLRVNHTLGPNEELPPIETGGILAVGDSFTFGSEVKDYESWPAQLEKILGIPVANGGAGGYGIDQAILRGEQLLDSVKPRAIVVSFIPDGVGRNEYSVNTGLIKPYFDVIDGKLELMNVPVPDYKPTVKYAGWLRGTLGYSYAIYWAADRLGLRSKWLLYQSETRKSTSHGVEVSCLLWKRLADRVAGQHIDLIALAQYAGIQINGHYQARESYQVEHVLQCARDAGYVVVDSYDELHRRLEADEPSFWKMWTHEPSDEGTSWNTGHMSPEGNRVTAELLASAIRTELPGVLKP